MYRLVGKQKDAEKDQIERKYYPDQAEDALQEIAYHVPKLSRGVELHGGEEEDPDNYKDYPPDVVDHTSFSASRFSR